jgi:hypothetical protein
MNAVSLFKSLCLPSKVYLVLSFIGILVSLFVPALGEFSLLMQLFHVVYVVFWTWVLNLICKAGYKIISWNLVLAPFILVFLMFTFVLGESVYNESKVENKKVPVIVLSK